MSKPAGSKKGAHISKEDISALVERRLSGAKEKNIVQHLSECRHCRSLAAEVAKSLAAVPDRKEHH